MSPLALLFRDSECAITCYTVYSNGLSDSSTKYFICIQVLYLIQTVTVVVVETS